MKIKKSDAEKLMVAMGYENAATWKPEKLKKKIEAVATADDPSEGIDDDIVGELIDAIVTAKENEEEIEIEDDGEGADEAGEKPEKKAGKKDKSKKAGKKEKATEEESEDEDEEEPEDDEDEAPAKKSKKGKKDKKSSDDEDAKDLKSKKGKGTKKPEKVGVIAFIIKILSKATERKPITKEAMLDQLAEQFPDRERDGMKVTINAQVPGRLKSEKKLDIRKNDKTPAGYWIAKSASDDE